LGLPSLRLRAEQAPGFAVALIAVAICLCLLHGTEREAFFAYLAEKDRSRDQIPSILRDDVGGEKVDIVECVRPLRVGLELAYISCAYAEGSGLYLHSYDAVAEIEGDVEGGGFSPGR
jgi:hypothetical protein